MKTFEDVSEAIAAVISELEGLDSFRASQAGLDRRCGDIMIGDDFIASSDRKSLDYYGGFEYVDDECRQIIGDWVIYSRESGRVGAIFSALGLDDSEESDGE